MSNPKNITYRDYYEQSAGIALDEMFYSLSGVDPDEEVQCNCHSLDGKTHDKDCEISLAQALCVAPTSTGVRRDSCWHHGFDKPNNVSIDFYDSNTLVIAVEDNKGATHYWEERLAPKKEETPELEPPDQTKRYQNRT